jgi:hypothetical protein
MTFRRFGVAVALLVGALTLSARNAHAVPITFTFDTSSIVGGSFTLAFDLTDGDATNNTTIVIDNFSFGGGGAAGGPTLTGGASGSVAGGITLTDTAFFNSFEEGFTAGSSLSFDVDYTTAASDAMPDGFAFFILDALGNPLTTTDPSGANALLLGTLQTTLGNDTSTVDQFALALVPEPATLALLSLGGVAAAYRRRHVH